MENFLQRPTEQKQVIEDFRSTLEGLPALLSVSDTDPRPLVFIIDELDRCRPVFALSLLERIKHFMSVPNVHFILGVHQKQLSNAVQTLYGQSAEDAQVYLQKFITVSLVMDTGEQDYRTGKQATYISHLYKNARLSNEAADRMNAGIDAFKRIATLNKISLRTIERIHSRIIIASAFSATNRAALPTVVTGLCCMKVARPDLYQKALSGKLRFDEVEEFLGFKMDTRLRSSVQSDYETWNLLLRSTSLPGNPQLSDHQMTLTNYLLNAGVEQPNDLVPLLAKEVVERMTP